MTRFIVSLFKIISAIIVIVITLFIILSVFGLLRINTTNAEQVTQVNTQPCPAGSYNIGISKTNEPLCKLNPTGCAYGDSIPLGFECDKAKENTERADQPIILPEIQGVGK